MPKVFVTRRIPETGLALLREKGYEVAVSPHDRVLSREELLEGVRGVDALLALLTDRIDAQVLDAAGPSLKIIANYAVGFDNLDLAAAKSRGIAVTNTPGVLTEAVAEHAFTLLLAVARRIPESDAFVRRGAYAGWSPMLFLGNEVHDKTLGIVGLGRIGSALAERAFRGFRMKILYTDVKPQAQFEADFQAQYRGLKGLLSEADFVSIHVPLLPSTRHLIGQNELRLMKPTAYLINTARGPIVDEMALVRALREGWIRGAALDVFEFEPRLAPGLEELPNVVLTPHTASATEEARSAMARLAAQNIIAFFEGQPLLSPVSP